MTITEVEVNAQGRVTIPKELRDALGLHGGSKLIARADDGRLVLEDRDRMLRQTQQRLRQRRKQAHSPLLASDELIAERRAEAEAAAE